MRRIIPFLLLILSFLIIPATAKVNVVRFPSGTPVPVCSSSDDSCISMSNINWSNINTYSGTINWQNADLYVRNLNVTGGGIQGELINKGYELIIPSPPYLVASGANVEVQGFGDFQGNLYIGYFDPASSNYDDKSTIYKWDGKTSSLFYLLGTGQEFSAIGAIQKYNGKLYIGNQTGFNGQNSGCIYAYDPTATPSNFLQMTSNINGAAVTSSVTIPNNNSNNAVFGSTAYSVEYYGRIDDLGASSTGNIVRKFNAAGNSGFKLGVNTGKTIQWNMRADGSNKATTTSTTFTLGNYHHIVASWTSGAAAKIYIDGVEASYSAAVASTTPGDDTANTLYFGNNTTGLGSFGGTFRRVRLWRNYALTASDVTSLYGGGSAASAPTAEYLFTEGSGTTVADTSGNANNGTVVSPAFWNSTLFDISYCTDTDKFANALAIFKGKLYAGMGYSVSRIYQYDGTTWSTSYSGLSGSGLVNAFFVYKGRLFASLSGSVSNNSALISTADGVTWNVENLSPYTTYTQFTRFTEFHGKLYVGTYKGSSGTTDLLVRNDSTGTWSSIYTFSSTSQCWGLANYNNAMYVGCTVTGGSVLYKSYDGVTFNADFTNNYAGGRGTEIFNTYNYNGSLYLGLGFATSTTGDVWRKTDSLGQMTDNIDRFIGRFRGYINSGLNWNEDDALINISAPTNFDSLVGFSNNGINWDNISNINPNQNINWNSVTGDRIGRILTRTTSGVNWNDISAGSGSGTVTQVSTSGGITGGPITTTGTVSLDSTYSPTFAGLTLTGPMSESFSSTSTSVGTYPTIGVSNTSLATQSLSEVYAQAGNGARKIRMFVNGLTNGVQFGTTTASTPFDLVASGTSVATVASTGITMADAKNITFDATTGTKIGTATTEKIGFYNSTPIVQPTGDACTGLQNLGLIASCINNQANINWNDINLVNKINSGGINWNDISLYNRLNSGGINWNSIPNYASVGVLETNPPTSVNWQTSTGTGSIARSVSPTFTGTVTTGALNVGSQPATFSSTGALSWAGNGNNISMNGGATLMGGNGFSSTAGATSSSLYMCSASSLTTGSCFSAASSSNSYTGSGLIRATYSGTSSGNALVATHSNASSSGDVAVLTGIGTGSQLRTAYDASNYCTHKVSSAGVLTLTCTGTAAGITLGNPVSSISSNILSTTTGIDAKSATTTTLYTVPSGKTAIIKGAVVRCTAASSITVGPTLGIGVAAGESDIFASTALTTLTTTTVIYDFPTGGVLVNAAAGAAIKVGIDAGATGTSQTIAIDLIGYLI